MIPPRTEQPFTFSPPAKLHIGPAIVAAIAVGTMLVCQIYAITPYVYAVVASVSFP